MLLVLNLSAILALAAFTGQDRLSRLYGSIMFAEL